MKSPPRMSGAEPAQAVAVVAAARTSLPARAGSRTVAWRLAMQSPDEVRA